MNTNITRLHSSRMHTAHSLTIVPIRRLLGGGRDKLVRWLASDPGWGEVDLCPWPEGSGGVVVDLWAWAGEGGGWPLVLSTFVGLYSVRITILTLTCGRCVACSEPHCPFMKNVCASQSSNPTYPTYHMYCSTNWLILTIEFFHY